jgi:hypothetical protein
MGAAPCGPGAGVVEVVPAGAGAVPGGVAGFCAIAAIGKASRPHRPTDSGRLQVIIVSL